MLRELPRSEGEEPTEGLRRNWHAGLPPPPTQLLEEASFDLTLEEAAYLRERIHASAPGSLLDVFVSRARPSRPVRFAWLHPEVAKLPKEVARSLELAHVFSDVMVGANLLYGLMLSEARSFDARQAEYRSLLEEWADRVNVPTDWSWDEFWAVALLSNRRIPLRTRQFVMGWFDLAPNGRGIAGRSTQSCAHSRSRASHEGKSGAPP